MTITVPFALGLKAQVGFLTHQVGFLSPTIGSVAAGWAVSLTTFAAVLGRIVAGYLADRFDRRVVACVNFIVQMFGIAILATATTPAMLLLRVWVVRPWCREYDIAPWLAGSAGFSKAAFLSHRQPSGRNQQFSFAFGPSLLGQLEHAGGSYGTGLLAYLLMEALAALIVISPTVTRYRKDGH